LAALVLAVLVWTAIGGLIGAARRFASNPSPGIRYVADASYWLYLVHLPLVLATHLLVAPRGLGMALTAAISVAVTTAIALVTYELFVRYTVLGRVLHGERARPVPDSLAAVGQAVSK
jgi:peptidoglycan/LPS O-acetylase OafA/YrhL